MIYFLLLIAIIVLLALRAWKHRRYFQRPIIDVPVNRRNRRLISRNKATVVNVNGEVKMKRLKR